MRTKTYLRILTVVLLVCVLVSAAHFIYAATAYHHASILYFIAKELW